MLDNNSLELIKLIATRMEPAEVRWALTGGANLALQGLDMEFNFIDVLVKNEDLDVTREIFNDFEEVNYIKLENGEGEEIVFAVKNFEIRVCGEYGHGYFLKFFDDIIFLERNGIKIPCFKLKNEMNICKKFDKTDRMKIIKKFLKR